MKISALMSRRAEITKGISSAQVEMAAARSQMSEISSRMENVDSEIERRRTDIEKLTESRQLTEKAIEGADRRITELDEDTAGLRAILQSLREQGAKARRDSENAALDAKDRERKARMLEDLEKSMEGFAGSVRSVMKMAERGELQGIHGPVSRLIDVPNEYATAVEIALGGKDSAAPFFRQTDTQGFFHRDENRGALYPPAHAGDPLRRTGCADGVIRHTRRGGL